LFTKLKKYNNKLFHRKRAAISRSYCISFFNYIIFRYNNNVSKKKLIKTVEHKKKTYLTFISTFYFLGFFCVSLPQKLCIFFFSPWCNLRPVILLQTVATRLALATKFVFSNETEGHGFWTARRSEKQGNYNWRLD